jgi:septal ring factor EnvC (AmiA/AmiB activator)
MDSISAIIIGLGGGAGIGSVLTTIFSYRKFRAEAEKMRVENTQTEMKYITSALKDINEETKRQFEEFKKSQKEEMDALKESHKAEIEDLKESNRILTKRIDVLNKRLASLMEWVTFDDARYRSWLENKIHELDPSIEFPELKDPPDVFDEIEDEV